MKSAFYISCFINLLLVVLIADHLNDCGNHKCKVPIDYKRYLEVVNSKDSACEILETGIVTFKPFIK